MINVLCVALVNASLAVEVYVSSAVLTSFFVKLRWSRWLKHHQRYQIMVLVSTRVYQFLVSTLAYHQ